MLKLLGLNAGIAMTDIVAFSPGLLGLTLIGGSILGTSISITTAIMSVATFSYGNYIILKSPDNQPILTNSIRTAEDYTNALKELRYKKTLEPKIILILEQIARIDKKEATITEILLQKFNVTEISFKKFNGTIAGVKDIFYLNIRSILNKMLAFDDQEYIRITKNKLNLSEQIKREKTSIFKEYFMFLESAIEENEEILLKFDRILLELSKLSTLESGDLSQMAEMKELNDLINNAKLYK